jgi:hypothetical protein
MGFQPSYQGGGVHVRNLSAGKNIVNATMQDSSALTTVNAVTAITASQIWTTISKGQGWKFKFMRDFSCILILIFISFLSYLCALFSPFKAVFLKLYGNRTDAGSPI